MANLLAARVFQLAAADMNWNDIAAQLGLTPGQLATRYSRSRILKAAFAQGRAQASRGRAESAPKGPAHG